MTTGSSRPKGLARLTAGAKIAFAVSEDLFPCRSPLAEDRER